MPLPLKIAFTRNNFHSTSIHHTYACYYTYIYTSTEQTQKISVSRTEVKILKLSSHSTKSHHCWVNNIYYKLKAMTTNVLRTLRHNTKYSIGCVEAEDKKYQCTEYNTTVLTGKSVCNRSNVPKVIIEQWDTDHLEETKI